MNDSKVTQETVQYPAYRWLMLAAAVLTMFCAQMITMSFAPFVEIIAEDLGVNLGTATFGFMGMNLFSTAVGVIIAGLLVDRIGLSRVMTGGLLLMLLANTSLPFIGHSFSAVVIIRIIEALGCAPALIIIEPTVSYWFPDKEKGLALGLNGFCILGPVGTGMFGPALVLGASSWQTGMLYFSIVLLIAAIFIIIVNIGSKQYLTPAMLNRKEAKEAPKQEFIKTIIQNPAFWLGLCVMAFSNWANQAFNNLSPAFLAVDPPVGAGYGVQAAGQFSAGTWLGMMVGFFISGFVIDKIFKGRTAPLVMFGFLANFILYNGILFHAINGSPAVLTMWLMLAGITNPFTSVGNQCFAVRTFSPDVIGKVAAIWTCISNFAGSIGVMAASLALRNTGDYKLSFALVGAASLIGFLSALISREKRAHIEELSNA